MFLDIGSPFTFVSYSVRQHLAVDLIPIDSDFLEHTLFPAGMVGGVRYPDVPREEFLFAEGVECEFGTIEVQWVDRADYTKRSHATRHLTRFATEPIRAFDDLFIRLGTSFITETAAELWLSGGSGPWISGQLTIP